MDWKFLLCQNKVQDISIRVNGDNERSEFERDYNKIIFGPFFRNLQNKTQLFPIPHTDFIHSRLTHSLEVSSVGKSLGGVVGKRIVTQGLAADLNDSFIRDISDIISAACLLHDVGNPPFGHAGEDAISSFFSKHTNFLVKVLPEDILLQLSNFDGNTQTLRIINNARNLNITLATVASIVKYPCTFNPSSIYKNKYSVFSTELPLLEKAFNACKIPKIQNQAIFARHPLAFLVEAADDICNRLLDLEDAHKLGLINYNDSQTLLLHIIESKRSDFADYIKDSLVGLTDEDKFARLRSHVLNILVVEVVDLFIEYYQQIMSGDYSEFIFKGKLNGLLDILMGQQSKLSLSLKEINDYVHDKAYAHKPVLEIELAGYEILDYLLGKFVFAVVEPSSKRNKKLISLLPERIRLQQYDVINNVMGVVEYLAGMTDKYALDLYRKLRGIELPST